jgi:hypothetical protein
MTLGVDYASIDYESLGNVEPGFAAAFAWGARFAILRAAYTLNGVAKTDPTWARHSVLARAAGLQVAPYVILGWHTDPVAQVNNLVAAYPTPQPGDLPPALDVEGVQGIAPAQAIAHVEAAVTALRAHYKTVMIYTSETVWSEQLGNAASAICGACPLWLKVGYPYKARNPPHPEAIPAATNVPVPWRAIDSPQAFLEQFQGDAIDVPGFRWAVDLDTFLPYTASSSDRRTTWVRGKLEAAGFPTGTTDAALASAIRAFQTDRRLTVDAVMGALTWAALCAA